MFPDPSFLSGPRSRLPATPHDALQHLTTPHTSTMLHDTPRLSTTPTTPRDTRHLTTPHNSSHSHGAPRHPTTPHDFCNSSQHPRPATPHVFIRHPPRNPARVRSSAANPPAALFPAGPVSAPLSAPRLSDRTHRLSDDTPLFRHSAAAPPSRTSETESRIFEPKRPALGKKTIFFYLAIVLQCNREPDRQTNRPPDHAKGRFPFRFESFPQHSATPENHCYDNETPRHPIEKNSFFHHF